MRKRHKSVSFLFFSALLLTLPSAFAQEVLPAADGPGGMGAVRNWATSRLSNAEASFANSKADRLGSPFFWGDEVVYSIQVDRFNDGDPSNNQNDIEDFQKQNQNGTEAGLPDYKHGGDLAGVVERLDYLQNLGVTSLWLTPILKGNGSYHGYCTSDFTQIDPSFGDLATLQKLTREAHKRGMRVVLDVVVNHMCNNETKYDNVKTPFQDWAYSACADDLNWKLWKGGSDVRGQRDLLFSKSFFPPFRSPHFFNRCGYKSGDFSTGGNGAIYGDFAPAMFDFNTTNWDFQDVFTDLHKYWIAAADIDGFRVDAAKHVSPDFLAKFSTSVRDYANSLGKNNFLLVGEVAANSFEQALRLGKMRMNPWNPWDRSSITPELVRSRVQDLLPVFPKHPMWPFPGLNAVYDFSHSGQAVEMWRQNKSPRAIKNWYWAGGETDNSQCSAEYCDVSGNGDARLNWNVLEIHDWPRFALFGAGAKALGSAYQYLLTAKGTPVIYYGGEQGLNGDCHWDSNLIQDPNVRNGMLNGMCRDGSFLNHSRYRQDMFVSGTFRLGSVVNSIDALAGIGKLSALTKPKTTAEDPYLKTDHQLFRDLRKSIAIRKSCSALRRGEIYFRAAHDNPNGGLLSYSRIDNGNEVLVVANTSSNWIPVKTLLIDRQINNRPFAKWKNLFNGYEYGTVGDFGPSRALFLAKDNGKGGTEGFSLAPQSLAIFVDEGNTTGWNSNLGSHLCLN